MIVGHREVNLAPTWGPLEEGVMGLYERLQQAEAARIRAQQEELKRQGSTMTYCELTPEQQRRLAEIEQHVAQQQARKGGR